MHFDTLRQLCTLSKRMSGIAVINGKNVKVRRMMVRVSISFYELYISQLIIQLCQTVKAFLLSMPHQLIHLICKNHEPDIVTALHVSTYKGPRWEHTVSLLSILSTHNRPS